METINKECRVAPVPWRRSLDDVPYKTIGRMAVKINLVAALAWDYALTVLDIAAQMRISSTKPLARAVRDLKRDYDILRSGLDNDHLRAEWRLAEIFESVNRDNFSRLCYGLLNEIRRDTNLSGPYESLVEAVQMALTVIDTLRLYGDQCDNYIRRYYPNAPHGILPDHFARLSALLPHFAGDCYDDHSETRRITARILFNEINRIELYEDNPDPSAADAPAAHGI